MNRALTFPDLSDEQWVFLAVLDLFDKSVSIDLAGYLAPLLPGPFFDLLEKTQSLGLVKKYNDNSLGLLRPIPDEVKHRLRNINTPGHLSHLAGRIRQRNESGNSDLREKLILFNKAGWVIEAGECEIELARQALNDNQAETACAYLEQTVNRFMDAGTTKEVGGLFVSSALEYSNLCFFLGRGFPGLEKILHKALESADMLGFQRAHVLLNFHLGRLYYFTDRRDDALIALSVGFEEIEPLDDEDIREQSAEFLGLYFFIKGLFREALEYFDKADKAAQSGQGVFIRNPLNPILLGYCAAFVGQFHRAIGSLDFNRRLFLERSDTALASSLRAVLGTVLILLGKNREGMVHLQQARKEAETLHNDFGLYLTGGGIALHHFLQGRVEKAYEVIRETFQAGRTAGLIRQFASPWILEMLYEFYRLGFEPIKDLEFSPLIERILSGVNIHLQGVAWRLRAKERLIKGEARLKVEEDLLESETCLRKAGDPVQLSKTILEMARLELGRGDRIEARNLLQKAKGLLGGYEEEFFPDEFRHFLDEQEINLEVRESGDRYLERYLEMIESLYPSETPSDIFAKMLTYTSRMFSAERSGLFWFPSGKFLPEPQLRAARNLTLREVQAEGFKNSRQLIKKTFQSGEPQIGRFARKKSADSMLAVRSSLCIPIEIEGKIHGVLYYDNSYLDDAFESSSPAALKQMVRHTNLVIERRFNYLQIRDQRNQLASEKSLLQEQDKGEIIHRTKIMKDLLKQVDQLAQTDSTILILGETGTGKELLARRIHDHSSRNKAPFIIVDVTTIPENLMESELFGHERGAFTGADNRKIGRIELAHQGTLFLDEVGELSLAAQAKLLRILQ
jgi:tetratricopeptide (TPR) repeat protein